jgi:hypothetical protein
VVDKVISMRCELVSLLTVGRISASFRNSTRNSWAHPRRKALQNRTRLAIHPSGWIAATVSVVMTVLSNPVMLLLPKSKLSPVR